MSVTLVVAVGSIPHSQLTENPLEATIKEVVSIRILRHDAGSSDSRLRQENGVEAAVEMIMNASNFPQPKCSA